MVKNRCADDPNSSIEALERRLQALTAENTSLKKAVTELQDKLVQARAPQNKLDLSEDKYRRIVNSIQEGYFETNMEGCITFCNQALTKISGYSREDIIGATFQQFVPPRTTRAMRSFFGKIFKSGQDAGATQFEVFHKDGHTLIVEFTAALKTDRLGEPLGFRGVLRDVSTQVKAAEKERRLQAQLQQAQKMEALGTLAGGLAHGFNNVLMAIQGNLSLISMYLAVDHPMQKYLHRINRATEKGSRLAREILSFAKVGKYVVMDTNLNRILKSTSRMFLRSSPGLRVVERYHDGLWPTRVDRVQIGQVLLGLYMQAAEAMPGGGDIYLQSENVCLDESYTMPFGNRPGRYVKISVTDSGIGLTKEAKRRIFEPFFSPYRPLRYEALGLATTYGIIKSHGGLINVYSEKGHGTTFNLYLPAILKETSENESSRRIGGGSETILLVDDDPMASQAARDILESRGYRVMMAGSGAEALDIYDKYKNKIQLVILDVILQDLSCDEICKKLKRIDPTALILLTSGYNINKQIATLLDQGCIDFVQKPFQTQTLGDKVRAALDQSDRL
jgi:two-component system, cell cycle sensor histidine kinase and response regulator CckA